MAAAANRIVWSYAMTPRYDILNCREFPWFLNHARKLREKPHQGGGGGGCLSQTLFFFKADGTNYVVLVLLQYCFSRTHIILIQGWWRTFMLCWFSHSIVFHRHISISIKADGTHLCCAGRELTVGNSPDFWITHGSYEKNLIRGGGGCLSQTHFLIQGWWHTFMLC